MTWLVPEGRKANAAIVCAICGRERSLYQRPSRPKPLVCSRSCAVRLARRRKPVSTFANRGSAHHNWKGDDINEKAGRARALKAFPRQPCEVCGALRVDRHHKDGNTANNAPENIAFLCRRHHMEADGRLERVRKQMRLIQKLSRKGRRQ